MTTPTRYSTRDTYTQDSDCCDPDQLGQQLIVRTHDGGGGWFLTVKTKRWALSDDAEIDAFAAMLKAVLARQPKAP